MAYTGIPTLFENIVANTHLTQAQMADAIIKHSGIRSVLNKAYYGITSTSANSLLVGSYGKQTAIRPPSDIDILFILPEAVYTRFSNRSGNVQSQLLQEVKWHLASEYPTTRLQADGQIIAVPFVSFAVEVLPAFLLSNGKYLHADSNGGGTWRTTDPKAEMSNLTSMNSVSNGKTTHLIKLIKAWRKEVGVHIKSLVIEILAAEFMLSWQHRTTAGYIYYDFMIRDFFQFLTNKSNIYLTIPGAGDFVYTQNSWLYQAQRAAIIAVDAVTYGSNDFPISAKEEWRKLFGKYTPL